MHEEFLMGNEAIALGALAAGVRVVAGYPGTPSTEVLETVAKRRSDDVWRCSGVRSPERTPDERRG
jgi:indolepyruvate ferredoxin oxidoreductase alpha subunit